MIYVPRHLAPLPGQPDHAATARQRIAVFAAMRAAIVLHHHVDTFPPARELHRHLLAAGAFEPRLVPSIRFEVAA